MKKSYMQVKNNCIANYKATEEHPGPDWQECPDDYYKYIGQSLDWFDKEGHRMPDDTLVKQGKRKDNSGRWYNKHKIGETQLIHGLDTPVDETIWTRLAPIENEAFQEWDESAKNYKVDEKRKRKAEKEQAVSSVKWEIEETEKKMIRPMRAIQAGRADKEDKKTFDELDAHIEKELRPKLVELEAELESA